MNQIKNQAKMLGRLYLLDSVIIPFTGKEATFVVHKTTVPHAAVVTRKRPIISGIKDAKTAEIISAVIGKPVKANQNKVYFKVYDEAFSFIFKEQFDADEADHHILLGNVLVYHISRLF